MDIWDQSVRKRKGRVREHPDFSDKTVKSAAIFGAALAGIAISAKKFNPKIRAGLAIGGAIGLSSLAAPKSTDPSATILGLAIAGAGAVFAHNLVSNKGLLGLRSLKSFLSKHSAAGPVQGATNAIKDAKKTFPVLDRLLSKHGLALGAGLITLPIAHSIMSQHFASMNRRTTDHREMAFASAWQNNQAGITSGRKSNATLFGNNQSNEVNLNFRGSVNSHYGTIPYD